EQQSLQITSAADYDTLNAVECKEGGYFFSSEFLSAFLKGQISVEEFKNICEMDATLGNGGLYAATKKISDDFKAKGNTIFQFTAAE
ncbi:MAG: hypothetical protein MJ178_07455, partial [Treponemataceae bacterium]|nr:hypothetical protein [Treponemataceae bacterium]